MSTTNGELYFTAIRTLERIEIQFVPRDLTYNRGAQYADIAIVGRNNPLQAYLGGSDELRLELDFHAEEANREDVIRKCKWLVALANADGYENGVEQVRLTFGSMFTDDVWTVRSVSPKYSNFQPKHGWLPQQAYVSLVLSKVTSKNTRQSEIKWN